MTVRDSLLVYLPQRVIIFPFYDYGNIFLTKVFLEMEKWDLLKNKKISGKEKFFKYFVEKEFSSIIKDITIIFKQLNFKIFTIYKDFNIHPNLLMYIKENNSILNSIFNIFKNLLGKKYLIKINHELKFFSEGKLFKGLKCGISSGEEVEFLIKILKNV